MLVLTRKMQERIQIGNNITITILRVKGNTVRVGIEAPREVRVVRGELNVHVDNEQEATEESAPVAKEDVDACSDEFGEVNTSTRVESHPQLLSV